MNKRKKIRLSCSLCLSFARNYGLYLAAWNEDGSHFIGGSITQLSPETYLNQVTNINVGNSIDIATLEWCKLFGNYDQEKLHWQKVVKNKANFKLQLLKHFDQNDSAWIAYHKSILNYRDKRVAHLDEADAEKVFVPFLEKALSLIFEYYNYLIDIESDLAIFTDDEKTPKIEEYFELHKRIGKEVYASIRKPQ
ncbi:MAG: hypothetical protein ACAH09_03645 [Methylophilaceae bacterium]